MSEKSNSILSDHEWVETEWSKDSLRFQDQSNLHAVSLEVPYLHSKYLNVHDRCRIKLIRLQSDIDSMEAFLEQYLAGTADQTEIDRWSEVFVKRGSMLPDLNRRVLKTDIPKVIGRCQPVIQDRLRLAILSETVNTTKEILKQLNGVSFHIQNAIKFVQMKNGLV